MRRMIFTLVAALLLLPATAQTIQHKRKVDAFGDKAAADSLDLYGILHDNAPGDFPASGVPYATLVGRGGNFVLGAGGFVKALAGWDIGHPMTNPDEFITSQIPVGPTDGDGSRFNLSARQTHLFVNFVAFPGRANELGAFVGANFLDVGYMPVVQYAYLKFRGFKAGYDNTLFSDPGCGPPAVDYEGPCSNTCSPVAGMSYTWRRGAWQAGLGIELPQVSFTVEEGRSRQVYQRVPDVPLAGQFSWDGGDSWVRASAIMRTLTYRDQTARRNYNCLGYGFQLSGAEVFLDRFTAYWQGVWGRGIASMLQDTAGEGLDLVPSPFDASRLTPVMLWGGFLALRCDICDRLAASATYSHVRTYGHPYAGGTTPWGDLYKSAQYFCVNCFFEACSFLEFGAEYIWGRRTNYDGLSGADNRLQASAQFTF